MSFSPILTTIHNDIHALLVATPGIVTAIIIFAIFCLTIRLRWWITPPRIIDKLDTQDEVLIAVNRTFIAHSIQLPVPQQEIFVENVASGSAANGQQNK